MVRGGVLSRPDILPCSKAKTIAMQQNARLVRIDL